VARSNLERSVVRKEYYLVVVDPSLTEIAGAFDSLAIKVVDSLVVQTSPVKVAAHSSSVVHLVVHMDCYRFEMMAADSSLMEAADS